MYEIRRVVRGWTEKNIRTGRHVTVSCGYDGERIEGTIGEVVIGALSEIFDHIPFKLIVPRAPNRNRAWCMIRDVVGIAPQYIAF